MSTDGSNSVEVPEHEARAARLRLKQLRLAAGKEPEELARFTGQSTASYYDLEECDGDLFATISLRELSALCEELGIGVRDLFFDGKLDGLPVSPEELLAKVREHLRDQSISVAEFEERIGFEIQASLEDSSKCGNWNVYFLRWFCRELGLDWRLALP